MCDLQQQKVIIIIADKNNVRCDQQRNLNLCKRGISPLGDFIKERILAKSEVH